MHLHAFLQVCSRITGDCNVCDVELTHLAAGCRRVQDVGFRHVQEVGRRSSFGHQSPGRSQAPRQIREVRNSRFVDRPKRRSPPGLAANHPDMRSEWFYLDPQVCRGPSVWLSELSARMILALVRQGCSCRALHRARTPSGNYAPGSRSWPTPTTPTGTRPSARWLSGAATGRPATPCRCCTCSTANRHWAMCKMRMGIQVCAWK